MHTRNRPHTAHSLLERTQAVDGCNMWQGAKRSNGYGVTMYMGKQTSTHRVMYTLVHGPVPDDMEVDHICNQRACINPDHLQLVTHAQNMRNGLVRRKTCRAGHPWTDENTYVTQVRYKGGTREQRYCRICRAKHQTDLRKRRNNKGGLVK
jgi:hypothetical protein